ncbi:glycerophosphoryl diester phosphodiesterase membrane domain-containing protein [Nocardiopsis sp. NPDC055879]
MSQEDGHRDTSGESPDGTEEQRSPDSGSSGGSERPAPGSPDQGPAAPGWAAPGQGATPPPTGTDDPGLAQPGHGEQPAYGQPSYGPPPGYVPPAQPGHGGHPPYGQHYGQQPSYGPPPGSVPPGVPGHGVPPGYPPGNGPQGGHGYGPGRPNAPKPGVVALRPMSLGDIFNGAFSYVRNNPKTTMGSALVVMALATILSSIASTLFLNDYTTFLDEVMADPMAVDPNAPLFPSSPLVMGLMYLGELIVYLGAAILLGLLAAVAGMAVLGHKLTPKQAWEAARGRIGAIIGLSLLKLLLGFVIGVVFFLAMFVAILVGVMVGYSSGGGAGVAVGLLVGLLAAVAVIAPAMWIWIRLYFAMPIVVLERIGPFQAIARSWRLSRGGWWRTLGYWILTGLIVMLVQMVLSGPVALITGVISVAAPEAAWLTILAGAITYLLTVLIYAVTQPFVAGVNTLLYVDLRMRREGLDLKLHQVAQRGGSSGPEIYLPEPRA